MNICEYEKTFTKDTLIGSFISLYSEKLRYGQCIKEIDRKIEKIQKRLNLNFIESEQLKAKALQYVELIAKKI
jgi:hypothetical protein